jgi:hypothetical protein
MIVHWKDESGDVYDIDTETASLKELRAARRALRAVDELHDYMRLAGYTPGSIAREWVAVTNAIAAASGVDTAEV